MRFEFFSSVYVLKASHFMIFEDHFREANGFMICGLGDQCHSQVVVK